MSTTKMILFTVLLVVASATTLAQDGCPNPAAECPGDCSGAQCPRFLNAECQMNRCRGLCTPNFFWRGRNVTNHCDVERCGDKLCPRRRQCIEEIVPSSCPENHPRCRQYILARCVLPRELTDCSQVSCGLGLFCRENKQRKEVACVRARNCNQLTCDAGFSCTESGGGPQCVQEEVTVQCSQELITLCEQRLARCDVVDSSPQCVVPMDCNDIECGPGLQCVVLKSITGMQDVALCVSDIDRHVKTPLAQRGQSVPSSPYLLSISQLVHALVKSLHPVCPLLSSSLVLVVCDATNKHKSAWTFSRRVSSSASLAMTSLAVRTTVLVFQIY